MKAKCVTNKLKDNNKINSDLTEFLQKDKIYDVYRLKFDNDVYFLIFDGSHLIEVPYQMFEIIDNTLPSNWVISVTNGIFTIGFDIFNSEYWFDDFTELPENVRKKIVFDLWHLK